MRYAILTDIHANFPALQAVQNDVERLRALDIDDRPIHFWFLGDLIGYGPHPVECIRWLRETSGIYPPEPGEELRWIPGNHDEWFVRNENVHVDALSSLQRHEQLLTEPANIDLADWFRGEVRRAIDGPTPYAEEPRSLVVKEFDGSMTAAFVHAGVMSRRGHYLRPWDTALLNDEAQRLSELVGDGPRPVVLFCGHTHFPMWLFWSPETGPRVQSIKYKEAMPLGKGLMIINPGSVGQPRDGDRRAAYLLLDPAARTVEFRRVEYPVEETTAALWADPAYTDEVRERLEQANHDVYRQLFETLYRRPQWDLEAITGDAR